MDTVQQAVTTTEGLQALLGALRRRGYHVVGPTVRDQAIVYDDIDAIADLPRGWTDEQDGGRYRLARGNDDALFGYAVGPHSWKKFLHPPVLNLWRAERDGSHVHVVTEPDPEERFAFIGVRSCELHAIAIQDRVFLGGAQVDPHYRARREGAFIVAVNCSTAGGTCFCVSMNTGPKATAGFDLVLTEVLDDGEHLFLVEAATDGTWSGNWGGQEGEATSITIANNQVVSFEYHGESTPISASTVTPTTVSYEHNGVTIAISRTGATTAMASLHSWLGNTTAQLTRQ